MTDMDSGLEALGRFIDKVKALGLPAAMVTDLQQIHRSLQASWRACQGLPPSDDPPPSSTDSSPPTFPGPQQRTDPIAWLNARLEEFAHRFQVPQRILVVDDEPVIQRVLCDFLTEQGFLTDVVTTGEEALEKLAELRYAVLIADKNLPGINGIELLKQVKRRWPRIEVLVMTGYASMDSALEAIAEDAFDYLTKPFSELSIVENKVRGALTRHDFEVRVHSMIEFLTQTCKNLFSERGQSLQGDLHDRLKALLAAYGQEDAKGQVVVVGLPSMAEAVERLGYQVVPAESTAAALEIMQQREVHVVIFIEEEGESDGAEVVRQLRMTRPDVGVFVVAWQGNLKNVVEAIGAGVGDYLVRPVEGRTLFPARLQRLVSRQQRVTRYSRLIAALKSLNIDLMANTDNPS